MGKPFKELGKGLKKIAPLVGFAAAGPLGAFIGYQAGKIGQGIADKNKAKKQGAQDAAASERSAIEDQGRRTDAERNRISADRASAQSKIAMGRRAANRRRVRGGLFGDSQVDQNVQARLG